MLRLKYTTKDGTETLFDLNALPAVLGRHPSAAVVIDNPGVSREHARLFKRGEAVLLADLNSSNGTYLNGKKVSRAELKAGDEIRLGRAVLIVEKCGTEKPAGPEIFYIDSVDVFDSVDAPPAAEPARIEPAARRAPPVQSTRPAPDTQRAIRSSDGVRVKDGLLQYHKISSDKKAGLMGSEFVQHHPFFRVVAIVVMLAVAAGFFFLFKWLTEKTVPAPWEGNQESIESEMDEDF